MMGCGKSHNESFIYICNEGELDIAKAMVERTQVDLEVTWGGDGRTPKHIATGNDHIAIVQYLETRGG